MPRGGGNDGNRANQMNPNNDAYWSSRGEASCLTPLCGKAYGWLWRAALLFDPFEM